VKRFRREHEQNARREFYNRPVFPRSAARLLLSLTIVAPAAPGGGWDQTARVMQRVLAETEPGLVIQVDNVPGAAGTIGLARFVQSERGNPDALMVMGLVMVSGAITNHSPVDPGDATPIARLTGETEVIVVPTASPYRSMRELMAAFIADPGRISWGGGSAGGTDDLLVRLMAEQAGLAASRVNYIAFAGGGAALSAVLGGQVTSGVGGYSEFAGQIEAGQLRVLAVSAAARVSGINAPTLREEGIALDLANWRAVLAPPGLSDQERDRITTLITHMAASEPWKNALAQNGWDDLFLAGPEFRQFLLSEQSRIRSVLERLAATNAASRGALTLSLTPSTVPSSLLVVFAVAVGALWVRRFRGSEVQRFTGSRVHAFGPTAIAFAALLAQPLIFPALGFVASSTILFAAIAFAMEARPFSASRMIRDLAIGLVFAGTLYLLFTRYLGGALP
jgi:putative tricarboxylic transport membrane protein